MFFCQLSRYIICYALKLKIACGKTFLRYTAFLMVILETNEYDNEEHD